MSVVAWLRDWWAAPLLLALSCALLAILNLAVIRDRYIVESRTAMHARYLVSAGHAVRCIAFLAPVVPVEWGDDGIRVMLLGGLVISYVLHLLGETIIVSRRILERWNRAPWDGAERRCGGDRRRNPAGRRPERRRGERRGTVTEPGAFDSAPAWPSLHDPWQR